MARLTSSANTWRQCSSIRHPTPRWRRRSTRIWRRAFITWTRSSWPRCATTRSPLPLKGEPEPLSFLPRCPCSQKYYTLALELFEAKCATGRLTWLLYGDINQRRVDYVKARVGALSVGQKPDKSKWAPPAAASSPARADGSNAHACHALGFRSALTFSPFWRRYLDGYGKERQWSPYELGPDGQEFGYLDYVNPVSWYKYYMAPAPEEVQAEAPAPA